MDQNMSDVAKQALDLAKSGIGELYAKAQQIAPEVWKMAYRQTILDGIEYTIGAILFTSVFGVISHWFFKQAIDYKSDGTFDDGKAGLYFVGFIFLAAAVGSLLGFGTTAINYLVNPSYWTLARLFAMAKGTF